MNAWLAALVLSFSNPVHPPTVIDHVQCVRPCSVSQAGFDLVRRFEGFSPIPYKDVAGKPTIGVGHLILKGESFDRPLLPHEADELLKKDMSGTEKGVNRRVKVELKQNQFDALASFVFNLGETSFARSTLLARVNAGRHSDVPAEFRKWVYADDKRCDGLVVRRNSEAEIYAA